MCSVMLVNGNALSIPLADNSVHMVVTSPPYWGLRDYGITDQLGLEATPEAYVANMVQVFREVKRILRNDGTLWLNLGDSYARLPSRGQKFEGGTFVGADTNGARTDVRMDIPPGLKEKDLVGIPWRVAFALQADGWWLRSDIIWNKPNPMPESVTDRPTKSHEYLFLLSKNAQYYYDQDAIREPLADAILPRAMRGVSADNKWSDGAPGSTAHTMSQPRPNRRKEWEQEHGGGGSGFNGHSGYVDANGRLLVNPNGRNKRTVWTIPTVAYPGSHFATYPPALVEPCIKAGTSERGCCAKCGAPYIREMTRNVPELGVDIPLAKRRDGTQGQASAMTSTSALRVSCSTNWTNWKAEHPNQLIGWFPSCTCHNADEGIDYEPVPCTVFDPFAGSGTTLMVARSLGRDAVGLDLSYPYLHEQARARLELDKLEAWSNGGKAQTVNLADLPMFQELP